MTTYKDSKVYQRAYKLAIELHLLLKNKIQEIDFTLANHLRREAREALGYIADGWTRISPKAKRFGFFRAADSIHQILMDLEFMHDVNNFPDKEYHQFFQEYESCSKQIYALMQSIQPSESKPEEVPVKAKASSKTQGISLRGKEAVAA